MQQQLPELFTPEQWTPLVKFFRLTKREHDVARLICLGLTNRGIGAELGVSPETVGMFTQSLFRKLDVQKKVGVPVRLVVALRAIDQAEQTAKAET